MIYIMNAMCRGYRDDWGIEGEWKGKGHGVWGERRENIGEVEGVCWGVAFDVAFNFKCWIMFCIVIFIRHVKLLYQIDKDRFDLTW